MATIPDVRTADAAANPASQIAAALGRLTSQQKFVLIIAVAAAIAFAVGGSMWARESSYRVLFSNISERDGGAIIGALEQLNIPYKFSDSGGAILVPGEKVHEVRLRLATQGLPKGGSVGFELMENQRFGVSQFAEQVNYQRGLEGELARTIQAVAAVQVARVHLAIPKPTVFVRAEQKPTASVMLQLYPGRALEAAQIAGITHLVASSVPQMPPTNVAIIDQNGSLLSQLKSKLAESGLDPVQIKYVKDVEAAVIRRIEDILDPIAGLGNTRVQVAADVDFSQSEQTAETYRPNQAPPEISIRSQQTSESASTSPNALGVPGALTNQPPVPATAPLTSPATPGAGGAIGGPPIPGQISAAGVTAAVSSIGQPINTRKDATINYEIDKTIRHVKSSLGAIKRLSVGVVVNYKKEPGKAGKSVAKPFTEAEIKQINDLVKEVMGYSKERGDTLSVVNSPFTIAEKPEVESSMLKDPETLAFVKEMIKYLAIAGVVAYLFLGVIRPLLRQAFPSGWMSERPALPHGTADQKQLFEEEVNDELNMALASYEHKVVKAKQIATDDPKVVANIVKDWITPNA